VRSFCSSLGLSQAKTLNVLVPAATILARVPAGPLQMAFHKIGSGPTEAFCKTLAVQHKGPGMRWDKCHAEGLMALASVRSSHLGNTYRSLQRKTCARRKTGVHTTHHDPVKGLDMRCATGHGEGRCGPFGKGSSWMSRTTFR
jgi:hypothetical protein